MGSLRRHLPPPLVSTPSKVLPPLARLGVTISCDLGFTEFFRFSIYVTVESHSSE